MDRECLFVRMWNQESVERSSDAPGESEVFRAVVLGDTFDVLSGLIRDFPQTVE